MADEICNFTKPAAEKIVKATKIVLGQGDDGSAGPSPTASAPYNVLYVVKITSVISGQGGRYNGRIWRTLANQSASGNLSASDLSSRSDADPGSDNCVIWNLSELGTSNQALYSSSKTTFVIGRRAGTDNSGKVIVECNVSTGVAPGTARGQVLSMTSASTMGWDYPRFW